MELGDKFTHKYTLTNTCEITGFTNRGYKVQLTEGKKKPKQAFFDKPDFDVKNGFWVKISASLSNVDGLKYPTFEDFLERISIYKIEKKKDAELLGIRLPNFSIGYFYSLFSLDGIDVAIYYSRYKPNDCSITVQGFKKKNFSNDDGFDVLMEESMEWLYKNYFNYSKNEKAWFKVYEQGIFDFYEFPQYFTYLGTYKQVSYDDVVIDFAKKGIDEKTIFIQKILYVYQDFKDELLNIDL